MSKLDKRVSDLENYTRPGELPILALTQSLDDPDLYTNEIKGITCRRSSNFADLGKDYQLIIVEYSETWPPGQPKEPT